MAQGASRRGRRSAPALAALLLPLLLLTSAPTAETSVAAVAESPGALKVNLSCALASPPAVRAAMDGEFASLLAATPENASMSAATGERLAAIGASPWSGALLGNRDGNVSLREEEAFAALLGGENGSLLPGLWDSPGNVAFGLRGSAAPVLTIASLAFGGAVGPDASSAPVEFTALIRYSFPAPTSPEELTLTAPARLSPLSCSGPLRLDLDTPGGERIYSSSGFEHVEITSDPLGFGPGVLHGEGSWGTNATYTVVIGPASPLGFFLIGTGLAAALAGAYLFWRRRERAGRAGRLRQARPSP